MKIFNLLNTIGFIFLLGSSAMSAEDAPMDDDSTAGDDQSEMSVEEPTIVEPSNESMELAQQVIKFWCSPRGSEMFKILKDPENRVNVINSLNFLDRRSWNHTLERPNFAYANYLATEVLSISGTTIFGNQRRLTNALSARWLALRYLEGNWTDSFFTLPSQQKESRQANAKKLVENTIQALENTSHEKWMDNKNTRAALGNMLKFIVFSALCIGMRVDLEIFLERNGKNWKEMKNKTIKKIKH